MTMFYIQSALLILIAFILGCLLGALLRKWFGGTEPTKEVVADVKPAPVKVVSKPIKPAAPKPVVTKTPPAKKAPTKRAPAKKAPIKRTAVKKTSAKDNLKEIKGIGPQNEQKLFDAGITTFDQISKWTVKDQRETGIKLSFSGRIEREEWVKQAKVLAKGGETQFSKRVAKGQVGSSK